MVDQSIKPNILWRLNSSTRLINIAHENKFDFSQTQNSAQARISDPFQITFIIKMAFSVEHSKLSLKFLTLLYTHKTIF